MDSNNPYGTNNYAYPRSGPANPAPQYVVDAHGRRAGCWVSDGEGSAGGAGGGEGSAEGSASGEVGGLCGVRHRAAVAEVRRHLGGGGKRGWAE